MAQFVRTRRNKERKCVELLEGDRCLIERRWMRMLAISCGKAFASSLISSREDAWVGTEEATPDLAEFSAET